MQPAQLVGTLDSVLFGLNVEKVAHFSDHFGLPLICTSLQNVEFCILSHFYFLILPEFCFNRACSASTSRAILTSFESQNYSFSYISLRLNTFLLICCLWLRWIFLWIILQRDILANSYCSIPRRYWGCCPWRLNIGTFFRCSLENISAISLHYSFCFFSLSKFTISYINHFKASSTKS